MTTQNDQLVGAGGIFIPDTFNEITEGYMKWGFEVSPDEDLFWMNTTHPKLKDFMRLGAVIVNNIAILTRNNLITTR